MNANHRDPGGGELSEAQLTAYALGQLDERERAGVEAKLAASQEARRLAEETRAVADHVSEANRHGPSPPPSPALREAVEQRLSQLEDSKMRTKDGPSRSQKRQRARRLWGILVLAACLLIAAVPLYFATIGARLDHRRELAAVPQADTEALMAHKPQDAAPEYKATAGMNLLVDDSATMTAGDPAGGTEPGRNVLDLDHDRGVSVGMGTGGVFSADLSVNGAQNVEASGTAGWPGYAAQGPTTLYPSTSYAPGPSDPLASQPGYPSTGLARYPAGYGDLGSGQASGGVPTGEIYFDAPSHANAGAAYPTISGAQVGPHNGFSVVPPAATAPGQSTSRLVANSGAYQPPSQPSSGELQAQLGQELAWRRLELSGARHGVGTGLADYPTAEPAWETESEVPGTEQYETMVESDFVRPVGKKALSTFSVDVDTASYANVRRFLTDGRLPPPAAVRIEEMVNYFAYDYPLPEGDVPFSVNMELAQCPWNGDHRLLRVGIKGQELHREERGPSNLVFLLDVSGSMRDANKLPLVQQGMKLLAKQLSEDDRVAIVTYANSAGVQLESTSGHQRQLILDAIDSLSAGGSTHGSAGIQLAYQQAAEHFVEGGTNRVILATDGDLNVGITQDDQLVRLIQDKAKSGVFLTVLGFGTGNLKDAKLEKLADSGNGIYAYVDNLSEAHKVLVEQMTGSLVTIAKDVKVQIEFNPAQVHSYRLIGYENRVLSARDFDNDKKDAGEIGAGHAVTALYEIVPARGEPPAGGEDRELKYQRVPRRDLTEEAHSDELATLKLRYKPPDAQESTKLEFVVSDPGKRFGEASADFRFASAVASFGMLLRGSLHAGSATLSAVEEFAAGAVGDDPGGYRAEFVELVRRARQLSPR